MALGSSSKNVKVIPEAFQVMNQFKYEVATELGINPEYKTGYWGGNIPSRECGAVGGHMVRRMVAAAQQSLLGQGGGDPRPQLPEVSGGAVSRRSRPFSKK